MVYGKIFPSKKCDPQGQGNFWPHEDNLNKLGRGPLGDATYQLPYIKALDHKVSDKIFSCIPSISLRKICDPLGRAIFRPGA